MQIYDSDAKDRVQNAEKLKMIEEQENLFLQSVLAAYDHSRPYTIELETLNYCNNDCSFCPASRISDKRKHMKMDEKLFYKIIDELAESHYMGILSLFSNNEPLLDRRIFDFLSYAKKKLPYAKHAMFTNGLLLNGENFEKLVSLLDWLCIDNYEDNHELLPNIMKLYEEKPDEKSCDVKVYLRSKNQVLDTRGGLSPNKESGYESFSPCVLPFIQMVIRPDGKVSRCCQDVYGGDTLGDLNEMSVKDVWNGKEYTELRNKMLNGRKNNFCRACDIYGMNNYTPTGMMALYAKAVAEHCQGRCVNFQLGYEEEKTATEILERFGARVKAPECDGSPETHDIYIFNDYDALYNSEEYGKKNKVELFAVKPEIWGAYRRQEAGKLILERCREAEKKDGLIFYGAGRNASIIHQKYNIRPRVVIDRNQKKIGTLFMGEIPVCSPTDVNIEKGKDLILITPQDNDDIRASLDHAGVPFLMGEYLL